MNNIWCSLMKFRIQLVPKLITQLDLLSDTGVRLAQVGYAVIGIDYEGHGKSAGTRGYIKSIDDLVTECATFFKSVAGTYSWDFFCMKIVKCYGDWYLSCA